MAKTKVQKQKTHKSTAKRFKISGSRKSLNVVHERQGSGGEHYMSKKNSSRKARLKPGNKVALASTKEAKKVVRLGNL